MKARSTGEFGITPCSWDILPRPFDGMEGTGRSMRDMEDMNRRREWNLKGAHNTTHEHCNRCHHLRESAKIRTSADDVTVRCPGARSQDVNPIFLTRVTQRSRSETIHRQLRRLTAFLQDPVTCGVCAWERQMRRMKMSPSEGGWSRGKWSGWAPQCAWPLKRALRL
jgi:hypothetical protein